jgi:hypothetical protein
MTVNQTTATRNYPKPHPSNELQVDVERLRTALDAIDTDVAARPTQSVVETLIAAAVANVLNSAPGALDTLQELANALGNDANFAASVANALAGKAPLDGVGATGTWGISITGNAATATSAGSATTATSASQVPWGGVQSKPSTLAGYGINLSGDLASEEEAITGTSTSKLMTPATAAAATAAALAAKPSISLGLALALG